MRTAILVGPTLAYVAHGGVSDVEKHMATSKHREALASRPLAGYFQSASALDQSAIRAEVLFANFVVERNLSFMVADHFTHLAKVMFPDSKTVQLKQRQHAL